MSTKYVVSVSSGAGSAYAWYKTIEAHGKENVVGLFADVNGEHIDNYRFLDEVQQHLDAELVVLDNEGRTIWDAMKKSRFLANSRIDVCSRVLKREPLQAWMKDNCDPAHTVLVLGIDWTEEHRFIRARDRYASLGWVCEAPMCDTPADKTEIFGWLEEIGIKRPLLYDLGLDHANCSGGCVKAGIKQWKHVLKVLPDVYQEWETQEQGMRDLLGANVSILIDRRGGERKPMTLRQLRDEVGVTFPNEEDDGSCNCFSGSDDWELPDPC